MTFLAKHESLDEFSKSKVVLIKPNKKMTYQQTLLMAFFNFKLSKPFSNGKLVSTR